MNRDEHSLLVAHETWSDVVIPHVIRIGHAILYVTNLTASRRFYVDLLGLHVLHESESALYLRGTEDREWTLKLELAAAPGVRHIAYKMASDQALDDAVAMAERLGLPYRWEEEKDRPKLLRMQDPFGFPIAFYYQSIRYKWLLQDYHLHTATGIQRVDHCNMLTPDVNNMMRWYMEELNFRLSEYSADDNGDVWAAWVQRRGSVHDLAMTNGRGPRMHHFAYWVPDSSRIFQICDVLGGAREFAAIERGPGRHGISNAFFVYILDPDGHRIEFYTSDYLTVDPDFEPIRWDLNDPARQQLWGGLAPKSWFTEGSLVERFEGGFETPVESRLKGLPAYIAE
jgi:catechol 2,3-dioxygenase